MTRPHPQAKEIKRFRKLLPEETKDLQDENVAFMVGRMEGVPDSELKTVWQLEHDKHVKEMALFLYDLYQDYKKRQSQ